LYSHTLKVGEQLYDAASDQPATGAATITISLDSTFIRSREKGEQHLEVRVGNVETAGGQRQVFGAVVKGDTDITALIHRSPEAVGQTNDSEVTDFTDGCPGLRSILAAAGIAKPPILDWFHIAIRMQPVAQAASGLSTDEPDRAKARAVIVAEVERLRWRIWNGKARNAQRSIDRIHKVMHAFKGKRRNCTRGVSSHKL
jgi:hypothetical protein